MEYDINSLPEEFWSVNMKSNYAYYCTEEAALSAVSQLRHNEPLIELERLSGTTIYIPRKAIESISQETPHNRAMARAFDKMLKDENREAGNFDE